MPISKLDLEGYISDLFSNFLYYDRKEDDDFTIEDASKLSSICTKEELTAMFLKQIDENYE